MNDAFIDYFGCPQVYADFRIKEGLSAHAGFFHWGKDVICYGRTAGGHLESKIDGHLYDVEGDVAFASSEVMLPFDHAEVIENLLRERYTAHFREPGSLSNALIRKSYYLLRPLLAVGVRKHLQKFHLRKWKSIPHPEWPVDISVDRIHRRLLALSMRAKGVTTVPFIWFWPGEYTSCAIVTHDVESECGKAFCGRLMDIDESYGFHSSFQIVPECRYAVSKGFLESIKTRGFEVNVHDLRHDGRLFADQEEFCRRAKRINEYAKEFGAEGFRSGILYRNADWYDALGVTYDMSIPNVGHLDPQRGGCCTVMPYFIGKLVELPLTCTQDHTLFNILEDYSIELWKQQISRIRENHGLITILSHPDYLIEPKAQQTYRSLLSHVADLRNSDHLWCPRPKEVAAWWHQRQAMKLVEGNGSWQIAGEGKERARIAYAHLVGDDVVYSFEEAGFGATPIPVMSVQSNSSHRDSRC